MHGLTFLLSDDKGELVNEERLLEIDRRGVTIGLASWSLEEELEDGVLGSCCC